MLITVTIRTTIPSAIFYLYQNVKRTSLPPTTGPFLLLSIRNRYASAAGPSNFITIFIKVKGIVLLTHIPKPTKWISSKRRRFYRSNTETYTYTATRSTYQCTSYPYSVCNWYWYRWYWWYPYYDWYWYCGRYYFGYICRNYG